MNPRVSGSPATVAVTAILSNAASRPLTLARPAASGKNSAEHAFRKRLNCQYLDGRVPSTLTEDDGESLFRECSGRWFGSEGRR